MPTYLKDVLMDPFLNARSRRSRIDAIDAIYDGYRDLTKDNRVPDWSPSYKEPKKENARIFLNMFAEACSGEEKTKSAAQNAQKLSRVTTLGAIQRFVSESATPTGQAFQSINRYRYAIELALRVRRPRVIAQAQTVLCGAASLLQAYFKAEPSKATEFALTLIDDGQARLRNYLVQPAAAVKAGCPDRIDMAPIDWVLLASVRYHFEPLADLVGWVWGEEAADPLRQLTKPGLLVRTLRQMGYKRVEDRTFLDDASTFTKVVSALTRYPLHSPGASSLRGEANLRQAEADLDQDRLIFLLAYGKLSEATPERKKGAHHVVKTKPQKEVMEEGFPALHWTLVRKLKVQTGTVWYRKYTWGGVREATFLKDNFLNVYQGHVMADPT
jgi:hypothetical protein